MILIIDNYDSFTYNLAQLAGAVDPDIRIVRNDEEGIRHLKNTSPSHVIISSGPENFGDDTIYHELLGPYKGGKIKTEGIPIHDISIHDIPIHDIPIHGIPILGIGLGYRLICRFFGALTEKAKKPVHGKPAGVHIANGCKIFKGLAPIIDASLYHTFTVNKMTLPDELLVIAEDTEGKVMGVKHRDYHIYGLEFHPESIMTSQGNQIIENFLKIGAGGL